MKIINGDLLDFKTGILAHQVNCQLKMGAGIALAIRKKYPRVYNHYKGFSRIAIGKRLGKAQIVEVLRGLYIANLFGQYNFLPRGQQHTDYTALTIAMRQMRQWRDNYKGNQFPIYFPFGIGCGLAGGDWGVVQGIIQDIIPNAIVVKLPTKVNK
jgi:O-acetyl-ADP-ribose deacetylase (regulator of RNase III)